MNELERAAADSACRQLLYRYATAVDARDWPRLLSVFTPDATWRRPEMQPMRGHAQILAFFEAVDTRRYTENPRGYLHRHMFTTISIEVADAARATGIAYGLVFMHRDYHGVRPVPLPPPELIVEYRDVFVRTADGWRISEHEAEHLFRSPEFRQPLKTEEIIRLNFGE
jgi:hypothetical protein